MDTAGAIMCDPALPRPGIMDRSEGRTVLGLSGQTATGIGAETTGIGLTAVGCVRRMRGPFGSRRNGAGTATVTGCAADIGAKKLARGPELPARARPTRSSQ